MVHEITQIGIQDYDCYSILWYGNYVKHYKHCIANSIGCAVKIKIIHQIKYIRSANWGEETVVRISNVTNEIYDDIAKKNPNFPKYDTGTAVLMCQWIAKLSGEVCNQTLMTVVADTIPINTFDALDESDHRVWKILSNTIRLPTKFIPDDKLLATYTASGTLYSDMWESLPTKGSSLNIVTTFDLFEQSRTNFFGGQAHLKSLRENHSLAMVVGWIKDCVIHDVFDLNNHVPITCEFKVGLVRISQNKTFELEQMICVNGNIIASTRLCMVCMDWNTKQISTLPDSYVDGML